MDEKEFAKKMRALYLAYRQMQLDHKREENVSLRVTLKDGRTETVLVTKDAATSLKAFINEAAPFNKPWVLLQHGEYVRHDFIVAVRCEG